jgi:hypothetical protein
VEDLDEAQLAMLAKQYRALREKASNDADDQESLSVDNVLPPVDRTLAALRPEGEDDTPPRATDASRKRHRPA